METEDEIRNAFETCQPTYLSYAWTSVTVLQYEEIWVKFS